MNSKSILLVLLLAIAQVGMAQNFGQSTSKGKASIKWVKTELDIGEVPQGKPIDLAYKLKNEGMVPVIITKVESTCGCTVPSYPKAPIKYGKTAKIVVTFDAKSLGAFYKTIKVYTNAGGKPKELRLRGTVVN